MKRHRPAFENSEVARRRATAQELQWRDRHENSCRVASHTGSHLTHFSFSALNHWTETVWKGLSTAGDKILEAAAASTAAFWLELCFLFFLGRRDSRIRDRHRRALGSVRRGTEISNAGKFMQKQEVKKAMKYILSSLLLNMYLLSNLTLELHKGVDLWTFVKSFHTTTNVLW